MEPLTFNPGGGAPRPKSALTITRVMEAPRERVWRAFTDAALFKRWWRPPGFTCPLVEMDVRVGGAYQVHMRSPRDTHHTFGGIYRTIEAPERLAYTWAFNEGRYANKETLVELAFGEMGGATEIALTQTGFTAEQMQADFGGGWENCLDMLADLLEEHEG
jgi:uncharacterized protein YndB with AHSA1/START domain